MDTIKGVLVLSNNYLQDIFVAMLINNWFEPIERRLPLQPL